MVKKLAHGLTYWFSNGHKKAQGKYLDIDTYVLESEISSTKLISKLPFILNFTGTKIGKWTYWNQEGKKILVVESKRKGEKIVDKVLFTRLN